MPGPNYNGGSGETRRIEQAERLTRLETRSEERHSQMQASITRVEKAIADGFKGVHTKVDGLSKRVGDLEKDTDRHAPIPIHQDRTDRIILAGNAPEYSEDYETAEAKIRRSVAIKAGSAAAGGTGLLALAIWQLVEIVKAIWGGG